MREYLKFYINGEWVEPAETKTLDVINPATEEVCGKIALGGAADVDKAVMAARAAFPAWSQTTREERLEVLGRILAEYQKRFGDLATAVTEEMGAPANLAQRAQVPIGMGHLATAVEVLKTFKFEEDRGPTETAWWMSACPRSIPGSGRLASRYDQAAGRRPTGPAERGLTSRFVRSTTQTGTDEERGPAVPHAIGVEGIPGRRDIC